MTHIGVELVLYFQTVQLITSRRKGLSYTRSDKTFLSLSTFLLCMITIYVVTQNFFGEEMWIMNEGYPGGTAQYFSDHASVWYQLFGTTSWVLMNLVSDAFLVSDMSRVAEREAHSRCMVHEDIPNVHRMGKRLAAHLLSVYSVDRNPGYVCPVAS